MADVDGYIRVSAVRGRSGASYISPSEQRKAIERWAAYKDLRVAVWHVDEDQSGGTHNRPGLEAAIERATTGQSSGIVAAKIDRFSRMSELGLRDLRVLQEAGARLAFAIEDIDTSGPLGKLIYTIMLAQAEYFLEQIKANWVGAKSRAVERGAYISRTPFGYERQADGTITPHPRYGEIVGDCYRLAAAGDIHSAVALLEREAPGRTWTTSTVRRMLARRVYLGETNSGQFTARTHDPLVDKRIWELTQRPSGRRLPRADFPLSGLAICGNCGQPLVGGHGGSKSLTRIYRCSATTQARATGVPRCQRGVVITASILEDYARGLLEGLEATVGNPDADALAVLERAIADAEAELDAFAGDLTLRRALGARYHDHLRDRVEAIEKAQAAYREKARGAQAALTLSTADLAEDPQLLPVVLRSMIGALVVLPGRGLSVAERVRIAPLDGDRPAGIAGAEGS